LRRRIAYVPESVVLYDNLTGIETLRFFAKLKRAPAASCPALLEKVGLGQAARRPVRQYSKGMRQRLGFAQALIGNPEILFLDEPTGGLDPEGISDFYRILAELRRQGVTALLSSHNLAEIEERVDRLALMKRGRIEAMGTVPGLREALQLPLRIELRLRSPDGTALHRVLAGVPGCELSVNGAGADIRCARERKMAVLHALAALGEEIEDIHLREPSLEDVFLGYTDAKPVRN
jgi:Cu-processing system ATP-binding protein